jgi:uncharacterized membrane protein YkoI
VLGAIGIVALLATIGAPAFAYRGQMLPIGAKIRIDQARRIALKAYPGKIIDERIEREAGGSGLRYSFDIKQRQNTQEVGVDAVSGRVLEDKAEGQNPD